MVGQGGLVWQTSDRGRVCPPALARIRAVRCSRTSLYLVCVVSSGAGAVEMRGCQRARVERRRRRAL